MTKLDIYRRTSELFLFCASVSTCFSQPSQDVLSLAGTWELALDSQSTGPEQLVFDKVIQLPGTLGEASIGEKTAFPPEMTSRQILQVGAVKKISYVGKAWYRKRVSIPSWASGKTAVLVLERVTWKSTVYVDGKEVGSSNSLSIPHEHDLTGFLDPGQHEIVICIDNSPQLNFYGVGTGGRTPWNGILGDFNISFFDQPFIGRTCIYADAGSKRVQITILGQFEPIEDFQIHFKITEKTIGKVIAESVMDMHPSQQYSLELESEVTQWDDLSPVLYILECSLLKDGRANQTHTDVFGFRKLEARGKQLVLNGNNIFLRGTSGGPWKLPDEHTVMDPSEWRKIFTIAKSYGLNHFRFHSSCPPEAAFEAADELGFYLQVECPIWSLNFGEDSGVVTYITEEAGRILAEYGNHPSFCLMSLGNEMEGDFELMNRMVEMLKATDSRILYATTSFTFQKGHGMYPEPVDDFFVTQWTDAGWVRGQGVFDLEYPSFDGDYTVTSSHIPVPLITHEIGQHTVYPNLRDMDGYTSVFSPVGFEVIRAEVEKKGLLSVVDDYVSASGKLQTILYKEEIERALKTPGIGGFQLLGIKDTTGNTAVVGVLNAFWEPKEYIDGPGFRQFCSEFVPLAWFKKAVYSAFETLVVDVGAANFYQNLRNQKLICELSERSGNVLQHRELAIQEMIRGETRKYGQLQFELAEIRTPRQLKLSLRLENTNYSNNWPLWVYPGKVMLDDEEILVTASFDAAERALDKGRSVLLSPPAEKLKGNPGKFVTVFWSPTHFSHWERASQVGTMGLLIDPEHAAFSLFPTEFHSNWQWWDLCKNSKTLEYGDLDVRPLVVVIDNYYKNRKLTNLFEVKVGNGKLVFSSIDLLSNLDRRIEARQLRHSLIHYMKSRRFNPEKGIDMHSLREDFEVTDGIWQYPSAKF